jgi:PKD repeat protein
MRKLMLALCFVALIILPQISKAQTCSAKINYKLWDTTNTYAFYNLGSSGAGFKYLWQFGDGNSSNSENPVHQYNRAGKYRVVLFVTASGCIDSMVVFVNANNQNPCNADFTFFKDTTNYLKYWFTSVDTSEASYIWKVNGAGSNAKSMDFTFTSSGNHSVCLVVQTPADHCIDTVCKAVSVAKCTAKFKAYGTGKSNTMAFTEYSIGKNLSYNWNFGDGTASFAQNPSHQFPKTGVYRVLLTINDSASGCTDTSSVLFGTTISGTQCQAEFDTLSDVKNRNFFNLIARNNTPQVYNRWLVNSFQVAEGNFLQYNFTIPGLNNVCLESYDSSKRCIDTMCNMVMVKNLKKCNLNVKIFSIPDSISETLILSCSTSAKKYSVLWKVHLSNTFVVYSSTKITKVSFPFTGLYKVEAIVYDSINKCFDTLSNLLPVYYLGTRCKADFTYISSTIKPLEYSFFSFTAYKHTSHRWVIDGKLQSSTQPYLVYTFPSYGSYKVELIVYDSTRKCLDTTLVNLKLSPSCIDAFTVKTTGLKADFTPVLNTPGFSYKYDFGDSTVSFASKPSHTYKMAGTYKVCQTVYCSSSDSSISCSAVTVNPCNALFTVALDTTKKYKLFLINKSSNTSSTTYSWDFGDGTSGSGRTPTHKYNSFGRFVICLTVKDGLCSSVYCDTIGLDSNGRLFKAGGWELVVIDQSVFGVTPIAQQSVKIYPNPTTGKFTVERGSGTSVFNNIEIIGMQGAVVYKEAIQLDGEKVEIDIETLNKGLYLVKLSNDHSFYITRIMKN